MVGEGTDEQEQQGSILPTKAMSQWEEHGKCFEIIDPMRNSLSMTSATISLDWDGELYHCRGVHFHVHIWALTEGLLYDKSTKTCEEIISYRGFKGVTSSLPPRRPSDEEIWSSESSAVRQAQKLISISVTMFKTPRSGIAAQLLERALILLEEEETTTTCTTCAQQGAAHDDGVRSRQPQRARQKSPS